MICRAMEKRRTIMQFEVIKTNIVNIAVDAIVLPANEHL